MPVRQFLSTISPVIAREPAVFVEAMANTCNVEEASGAMGSGRPIVLLKPKVGTMYTQTSYQSALVAITLSDSDTMATQLHALLTVATGVTSLCRIASIVLNRYRQICLCLPAT